MLRQVSRDALLFKGMSDRALEGGAQKGLRHARTLDTGTASRDGPQMNIAEPSQVSNVARFGCFYV